MGILDTLGGECMVSIFQVHIPLCIGYVFDCMKQIEVCFDDGIGWCDCGLSDVHVFEEHCICHSDCTSCFDPHTVTAIVLECRADVESITRVFSP